MVAVAEYRSVLPLPVIHPSSLRTLHKLEQRSGLNNTSYEWLSAYEKRPDSIFSYYSIPNEITFLQKAEGLTQERKKYYIEENVRRFLAEFVGKVPYTTIPYEIDSQGFSYANMHVMDSYNNATLLGGEREQAENVGFSQIEAEMIQSLHAPQELQTTAFWISPPKIADYGFVFVMKPEGNGKVKEYILRYPEKQTDLTKSAQLYQRISQDNLAPQDTNSFLRSPLFGKLGEHFDFDLHQIMQMIGISNEKIEQSRNFEMQVDQKLGSWIAQFANSIILVTEHGRTPTVEDITQCKLLLLSIYQQAQEIVSLQLYGNAMHELSEYFDIPQSRFSWDKLAGYATIFAINSNLPTADAGSCPALEDGNASLDPVARYISNHDIITQLRHSTPESIAQNKNVLTQDNKTDKKLDCTCPFCNEKVSAIISDGKITCPRKECGKSAPYAC